MVGYLILTFMICRGPFFLSWLIKITGNIFEYKIYMLYNNLIFSQKSTTYMKHFTKSVSNRFDGAVEYIKF